MAAKHREVIWDYTFEEQVKLLQPDTKHLDEIIDGVTWLISTHPERCAIVESNLRVAFTDTFPDAPAMRIFFTITDDNTCTLHWIERLEDEDEG
jgi:hypothetical protein